MSWAQVVIGLWAFVFFSSCKETPGGKEKEADEQEEAPFEEKNKPIEEIKASVDLTKYVAFATGGGTGLNLSGDQSGILFGISENGDAEKVSFSDSASELRVSRIYNLREYVIFILNHDTLA